MTREDYRWGGPMRCVTKWVDKTRFAVLCPPPLTDLLHTQPIHGAFTAAALMCAPLLSTCQTWTTWPLQLGGHHPNCHRRGWCNPATPSTSSSSINMPDAAPRPPPLPSSVDLFDAAPLSPPLPVTTHSTETHPISAWQHGGGESHIRPRLHQRLTLSLTLHRLCAPNLTWIHTGRHFTNMPPRWSCFLPERGCGGSLDPRSRSWTQLYLTLFWLLH